MFNFKNTTKGREIPRPIGNPNPDATRIEEDPVVLPDAFPDNNKNDIVQGTNPLNETRDSEIKFTDNPMRVDDADVTSSTTYVNAEDGKSIPLNDLVNIAVNILKQTTKKDIFDDNSNASVPVKALLSIALDILKKTEKPDKEYSIAQSARFKDIVISIETVNKYDKTGSKMDAKSESILSTITPIYDANNILKITGYKIEDSKNEATDGNKLIDELNLAEVNLTELQNPEKKPEIIKNIIEILKEKYKIGEDEEKSIQEYLDKLGETVNNLKTNVEGLDDDVKKLQKI